MIARNQALYFFPLLLLAAHAVGGVLLLLWLLSPLHALAFIGVEQGLLGLYLGVSFAPNHKGMPLASSETNDDFLRRQARRIVKTFCAERAICYRETTAVDSYRQVLRYLRSVTPTS